LFCQRIAVQGRRNQSSVKCYDKTDRCSRPSRTNLLIESGLIGSLRKVVDLVAKLTQLATHESAEPFSDTVRGPLEEKFLLPFKYELLIAYRIERQPAENDARQNHGKQENECKPSHQDDDIESA
jgi:hypothetical protein